MPARRVTYDPAMDVTIERMTGHAVDPSISFGGARPRRGQFMHWDQRCTIEDLAERLGIGVQRQVKAKRHRQGTSKYPTWTDSDLWGAIYEKTRGGIQRPTDVVVGDPFCLFLTGYCEEGHAPYEATIVAQKDGGVPMDEHEGKEKLAEMKATFPVCDATLPSGQACGKPFHCWSSDMTRMSTFREKQKSR